MRSDRSQTRPNIIICVAAALLAIAPASSGLAADGVFTTTVKGGAFQARFQRAAQLELAEWLEQDRDGQIELVVSGTRTRVVHCDFGITLYLASLCSGRGN